MILVQGKKKEILVKSFFVYSRILSLIIFAGVPTHILFEGIFVKTELLTPTKEPSCIVTPGAIKTSAAIHT